MNTKKKFEEKDKAQELYLDIAKKSMFYDSNRQFFWLIVVIVVLVLFYGGYITLILIFSLLK